MGARKVGVLFAEVLDIFEAQCLAVVVIPRIAGVALNCVDGCIHATITTGPKGRPFQVIHFSFARHFVSFFCNEFMKNNSKL
jgi:hypothetical protein